jgi:ferredoxin-thioredoxin reductase catalytic subunit
MSQAVFSASPLEALGGYISQPTKLNPVSVRKEVSAGMSSNSGQYGSQKKSECSCRHSVVERDKSV